jgi:hypothetical protein
MLSNKDNIKMLKLEKAAIEAQISELESKGERFKPERGDKYFIVTGDGGVGENLCGSNARMDNFLYDNFNCYKTKALANKADVMMKRSNAIIMACLMVDPDFVPDYLSGNQEHYSFYYITPELSGVGCWAMSGAYQANRGPCVSTEEKWHEAAALFKEWGVE